LVPLSFAAEATSRQQGQLLRQQSNWQTYFAIASGKVLGPEVLPPASEALGEE
jgi:hypothetical protein